MVKKGTIALIQAQPDHISDSPLGAVLNHSSEDADGEGISRTVKRYGDSSSVGMSIVLVAAFLPTELETIPKKCADKFTGSYGA